MFGRRGQGIFGANKIRMQTLWQRFQQRPIYRVLLIVFLITIGVWLFSRDTQRPQPPPEEAPLGCSPLLFVPPPIKYDFCVITRVKNSAEWLPEWIEYHKLLGAEKFFIADDCSDDNGETVKVLEYYSSLGFMEHYTNVSVHPCNIPDRQPHEELLISYVFKQAKEAQCDWVTMLDIDEYITILDGFEHRGGIRRIFQASMLPYLKLGWWTIGSDGHEVKPNKLTIESYRRGIFEDYHTKMIARAPAVEEWGQSLWPTKMEKHAECLMGPIHRLKTDERETRVIEVDGKTARIPVAPIIIKHYVYRSWEEYMRSRGATPKTSNSDINPWYNNINRWLSGNFTTFELAPEFTSDMAEKVRGELRKRKLPKISHFPKLD
jgi:hypothetical protein